MTPNAVETAKDAMLRTFAAQLRVERPGLTHARSFQLAQEAHPELREEFASEASASQTPYRYRPTARKPFVHKPFPEERERVQADKEDVDRSGWVRVEAADGGQEKLYICYGADGEVSGLELITSGGGNRTTT